jgi:hypothetical protein
MKGFLKGSLFSLYHLPSLQHNYWLNSITPIFRENHKKVTKSTVLNDPFRIKFCKYR